MLDTCLQAAESSMEGSALRALESHMKAMELHLTRSPISIDLSRLVSLGRLPHQSKGKDRHRPSLASNPHHRSGVSWEM